MVALCAAVLAILVRGVFEPLLVHTGFYVTVYIAVVYSALVCGVGPAILSAIVATAGVVYWFVDHGQLFLIADRASRRELHGLIACVLVCPVLIALGEANRRKQLQLNEAHDRLDQRVKERTMELSLALNKLESEVNVRKDAEEQLRHLSVRLMNVQDEERRRMARDLHDSAGQTLAAIKMTLALLQQATVDKPESRQFLRDLDALTQEALQEIRTTSYLLHPPLLDESGFCSAARWFVEGFTRRSGIHVDCDVPDQAERLPENIEIVLFRILQESLTNVHRHSGASGVRVTFGRDQDDIRLQVSDNGHGIPQDRLRQLHESNGHAGVGITGMRERVRELGGQIEVHSDHNGTTVNVTLPHAPSLPAKFSANHSAA